MITMDQTLTCQGCAGRFTFSAREQEFFAQRGFSTPKRCKSCRASTRTNQQGPARRDVGSSARQLHLLTCGKCGAKDMLSAQPPPGGAARCRDCVAGQPQAGAAFVGL